MPNLVVRVAADGLCNERERSTSGHGGSVGRATARRLVRAFAERVCKRRETIWSRPSISAQRPMATSPSGDALFATAEHRHGGGCVVSASWPPAVVPELVARLVARSMTVNAVARRKLAVSWCVCCAPPGSRTQNLRIKSPAQLVRPVLPSPQNRGFVQKSVQGVLPNPPQSGEFVAEIVARLRAS